MSGHRRYPGPDKEAGDRVPPLGPDRPDGRTPYAAERPPEEPKGPKWQIEQVTILGGLDNSGRKLLDLYLSKGWEPYAVTSEHGVHTHFLRKEIR